jgi:hypothetical protein
MLLSIAHVYKVGDVVALSSSLADRCGRAIWSVYEICEFLNVQISISRGADKALMAAKLRCVAFVRRFTIGVPALVCNAEHGGAMHSAFVRDLRAPPFALNLSQR